MSASATIFREIRSADSDACARGLRRVTQRLATDSVHSKPPADWQAQRDALVELEPRFLELAQSADDVLRELVADLLGAWLGDAALAALLVLARDPAERVRASAVGALESWPHSAEAKKRCWTPRSQISGPSECALCVRSTRLKVRRPWTRCFAG